MVLGKLLTSVCPCRQAVLVPAAKVADGLARNLYTDAQWVPILLVKYIIAKVVSLMCVRVCVCLPGYRGSGREELARLVDSTASYSGNMRRHTVGHCHRHAR